MQRPLVLRLTLVLFLDLEQVVRLLAVLARFEHDALGIDLDPLERPERLEDGRLAIGAADRTMGPVIERYPPEVG